MRKKGGQVVMGPPQPRPQVQTHVPPPPPRVGDPLVRLVASLSDTYKPVGVLIWLDSPNRHLGGRSPRELIADDEWAPLFAEADRMAGGPAA